MATRNIDNEIDVKQSLAPAARTTTASGTGVDLQDFDAAMVVFHPGAITDGTHAPSVEESDDDSTYTAVAAGDLHGTLANLAANTVQRVGYLGTKRYIRAKITVTGSPATG